MYSRLRAKTKNIQRIKIGTSQRHKSVLRALSHKPLAVQISNIWRLCLISSVSYNTTDCEQCNDDANKSNAGKFLHNIKKYSHETSETLNPLARENEKCCGKTSQQQQRTRSRRRAGGRLLYLPLISIFQQSISQLSIVHSKHICPVECVHRKAS